jgi:hypothetical protein
VDLCGHGFAGGFVLQWYAEVDQSEVCEHGRIPWEERAGLHWRIDSGHVQRVVAGVELI